MSDDGSDDVEYEVIEVEEEVEVDEMEEEEEEQEREKKKSRMSPAEDDEEFEFEYEDEDEDMEDEVDIENEYYKAKSAAKEGKSNAALAGFQKVLAMQKTKSKWGFRALKQLIKLLFQLKRYDELMKRYEEFLSYMKQGIVTRNDSERAINRTLDLVSSVQFDNTSNYPEPFQDQKPLQSHQQTEFQLLQNLYQATLQALIESKNDRLWFNTKLKLGKLYFNMGDLVRLKDILKELHASCKEARPDDPHRGAQLLEVYELEIQMYTIQKNHKKLQELYNKALQLKFKSHVPHPRIMAVIRECGGKMHMQQQNWAEAHSDFFEAFKAYDEAGMPRRIQCLKYLVLANMLMNSTINPFESQEAMPYKNDPEVMAMTALVQAYQQNPPDVAEFERILRANRKTIMEDPFIRDYIEELLRTVRTQVLLSLIKPYTRIRIPFIAEQLNITNDEVEELLVALILDNQIAGRIDSINQILELRTDNRVDGSKRYVAMDKWANKLEDILNRMTI